MHSKLAFYEMTRFDMIDVVFTALEKKTKKNEILAVAFQLKQLKRKLEKISRHLLDSHPWP